MGQSGNDGIPDEDETDPVYPPNSGPPFSSTYSFDKDEGGTDETLDTDGDGLTNAEELAMGTDPHITIIDNNSIIA